VISCCRLLPPSLAACGNVFGGFVSDALVKRFGLKWGRRAVGLFGLSCATFFIVAAILTTNRFATLLFLGLVYAGAALTWLRIDATEELIPEEDAESVLEVAAIA
jgi:hypothetical protein